MRTETLKREGSQRVGDPGHDQPLGATRQGIARAVATGVQTGWGDGGAEAAERDANEGHGKSPLRVRFRMVWDPWFKKSLNISLSQPLCYEKFKNFLGRKIRLSHDSPSFFSQFLHLFLLRLMVFTFSRSWPSCMPTKRSCKRNCRRFEKASGKMMSLPENG